MKVEFENGSKSKVVGLVMVYNFGVLSFQNFHEKFKVILIFPKSRILSPFDFELTFQNLERI
jgi:hypothetical protein